jgi:hypothetical protein
MTPREMQIAFDMQLQLVSADFKVLQKPDSYTIFYFLNDAQLMMVKALYTGLNDEAIGFEQTQKRIDDLKTLVKEVIITAISGSPLTVKDNCYLVDLPTDYLFRVGEEVNISFTNLDGNAITKRVGVTQSTADTYLNSLENPYGEHKLHYDEAKPLRLFKDTYVELISDGTYVIDNYILRYIKNPSEIKIEGEDCELPEHLHLQLVDKAVNLFLESAGGKARFQNRRAELEDKV